MGSIHNTRIFRFLLVLGAVILTILIYASYSSNTSIGPPHMRNAASSAAVAVPLSSGSVFGQQQQPLIANKSDHSVRLVHGGRNFLELQNAQKHDNKINGKSLPITGPVVINGIGGVLVPRIHHREPTIDVDAGGASGSPAGVGVGAGGGDTAIGNNMGADDLVDENFNNNDQLDEYIQSIDNVFGNTNLSTMGDLQSSQKVQSIPSPQEKLNQNQINDNNNLNKISDSDVLIPTSNLQKFIENADKILKNMTAMPAFDTNKTLDKLNGKSSPKTASEKNDPDYNDEGKPPGVQSSQVMVLMKQAGLTLSKSSTKDNEKQKSKVTVKITMKNTAKPSTAKPNGAKVTDGKVIDPLQGIPTEQIYESGHMNNEIDLERLCPKKGSDLKLLILITSAQAHADARLAIRQTWGHYGIRRDVSTAFVLGRSTNETLNKALTQENFIYGDLIRGQFIDSYNNLTLKTISSLEWVNEHCMNAKYILKTDDDMFINVPKLLAFLDKHLNDKRVIFGRLAKKWKPIRNKKSKYYVSTGQFTAPLYPPFTTGPAYVMSRDIIHDLYVRSLHQLYLKLEDVFTTGIVAQQLGIKRVHVNEFYNRRINLIPCNIRKTISIHMIKKNEQFDLWKKLLDQTTECK